MNTEEIIKKTATPRFAIGTVYLTPGFVEAYTSTDVMDSRIYELLCRHSVGDWGEVCPEDAYSNDVEAAHKGRIMSTYTVGVAADHRITVWVITDPGHEVTTILLPSEY